ncbi:MAG: periplasmic heavy metal sensor [Tabrizicola sp.]|jgi:uncharacterized membrane protein|nr:periplasmic heavy metal sensor [Tabrizicola sp.]
MTETREDPQRSGAPRWMKLALATSVALNLAVAGLAVGAILKDGRRGGMPRDLSFGPFTEAFSPEDRKALREAFRDRMPAFRASREEVRAEFQALVTALRTDPVDPAALGAALAAIEARNADRLALGRSLVEARLLQMSSEDRKAFADRLEHGLGKPD